MSAPARFEGPAGALLDGAPPRLRFDASTEFMARFVRVAPGARAAEPACGSGMLSLSMARSGAREVIGTDIDRAAIDAARANAALNAVAGNYLSWGRLDDAKRYFSEALCMAIDRGVKGFTHWIIGGFDWVARKEGRMERAALLRAVAVRGVLGDLDYRDDRDSRDFLAAFHFAPRIG